MSSQEHKTTQKPEGHYCELCQCWFNQPPDGYCPGVKVYRYDDIPWPEMTTKTQLREAHKRKPAKDQQPAGCYFRHKDQEYIFLFLIADAVPVRSTSEKQREVLTQAREKLKLRHTCQRCGWYDKTHGKSRSRYYEGGVYIHNVGGEDKLYCEDCLRYVVWCSDRHDIEKAMAELFSQEANGKPFAVIDTETTGLPHQTGFQVVEIGIVDMSGAVLFHSLIKPNAPIHPRARRKHGISDEMLQNAPTFLEIWPILLPILLKYELWAYGAEFDRDAILSSAARYEIEVPKEIRSPKHWQCVMETFADHYGMWSARHNSYKWQELWFACQHLNVPGSGQHRALADALDALGVMHALAQLNGTSPTPDDQPIYVRGEYYPEDYDEDDY